MHRSLALMHCASQLKIQEVLHKVGMKFPIRCGEPEVRVDLPDTIQYNQLWHQDWRTGQSSLNSVTIWFPLHDVSKKNGAIEIYPESHLWGFVDTIMHENPRRFEIIDKRVKNFSGVVANLQFGECLVFSQMLVHRSGQNTSNLARICCQIRYADATEENYIKNSYKIPLDHKNQFVWDNAPDEKIMKKVYDFKDK